MDASTFVAVQWDELGNSNVPKIVVGTIGINLLVFVGTARVLGAVNTGVVEDCGWRNSD